jgi:thiaminase II
MEEKVMVATSGAQLLPHDAVRNMRELLLPMTTILTPNIPEAILLLKGTGLFPEAPTNVDGLKDLARALHRLGPKAILLKGGHMPMTKSFIKAERDEDKHLTIDIFYNGEDFEVITSEYLNVKNTHGTGCSLASAIAANLALQITPLNTNIVSRSSRVPKQDISLLAAVRKAIRYIQTAIYLSDPSLGKSSGPISHLHPISIRPFTSGHFIDTYLLPHALIAPLWQRYTHHPFATAMARNILPLDIFKRFLVQDYLYLTHFARTYALAGHKSQSMTQIVDAADTVLSIQKEMELHLSYCTEFGISKDEIEGTPESLACTAYSRYVLDIGMSQDLLALQISLLSCLLGYQEVAVRLSQEAESVKGTEGNRYWRWVENYISIEYQEAVKKGRESVEKEILKQGTERIEELVKIFARATEMEIAFWDFERFEAGETEKT